MHGAANRGKYRLAIETRAKRHFHREGPRRILAAAEALTASRSATQEMMMSRLTKPSRAIAAIAVLATTGFAAAAQAGECPAGKHAANARQPAEHAVQGVTDTTLGAIDLGKEQAKITGRELRFRKMVIQPGGVVPWHSHDDRPALIYVAEGEIVEYASNCVDPIVHKAGEIRAETNGTSHWWKNHTGAPVVLFIGDVRRDPNDHNM
jgi:quercetin dioxygenase-like cupin family protein